jgi:hypothetical protein
MAIPTPQALILREVLQKALKEYQFKIILYIEEERKPSKTTHIHD